MGVVPPKPGFLKRLRELCDEHNCLLIFDEVITGFRLAFGGAAEYFGIRPDLVTYGKIIGAGMPVGAYGGRKEIMDLISPCGPVYQAGTLSGNPVAMAAGFTQLKYLYEHQEAEIYQKDIEKYFGICRSGVTNIIQALEKKGLVCRASVASDARLKKVMLTEAGRESHEKLGEIFKRMDAELEEGITEEELQAFLRVTHKVHLNLRKMRGENS